MGAVVKAGRKIIATAILSLSAAGAIAPAVATAAPAVTAVTASAYSPNTHFYV